MRAIFPIALMLALAVPASAQPWRGTLREYDLHGRVWKVELWSSEPRNGSSSTSLLEFDSLGNLLSAKGRDSGIRYLYDSLGRRTEGWRWGGTRDSIHTTFVYGEDSRLLREYESRPLGGDTALRIDYLYDSLQRVIAVTMTGSGPAAVVRSYDYGFPGVIIERFFQSLPETQSGGFAHTVPVTTTTVYLPDGQRVSACDDDPRAVVLGGRRTVQGDGGEGTVVDSSGKVLAKMQYEYEPGGNWITQTVSTDVGGDGTPALLPVRVVRRVIHTIPGELPWPPSR
ncbi:MAG: hypothetical protein JWQ98_2057 [Chlorobi bacterium]|nr:hypothetical protein [Chlorobiota bacterium]